MKTVNKINQIFSFRSTLSAVSALALLTILACTQDKSLDQFRQQQANDYAAQYNAVVAKYSGAVVSQQGNSKLGNMTLQIESGKQVQGSSDGLGNETKAVLTGHIIYNGIVQANVSFSQGVYNPNDGSFNVLIPITDEAGMSQSISVDGKIQAGAFTGSVYMTQYEEYGLSVSLSVNNSTTGTAAVDNKSLRAQQLNQDSGAFIGPFSYVDSTTGKTVNSSMKLVISNPATNPQQQFLRMLNPVRVVAVDVRNLVVSADGTPLAYEPLFVTSTGTTVAGPIVFNLSDADATHAAQIVGSGLITGVPVGLTCSEQQTDTATGALGWLCNVKGGGHIPKNILLSPDPNAN